MTEALSWFCNGRNACCFLQVKRRVSRRSLRVVLLYEMGTAPHKSSWLKLVMRLFVADGKALSVTFLDGGLAAFQAQYPFAIRTGTAPMVRTYPNEIIR